MEKYQISYRKHKKYYQAYYQKNKSPRKYLICVICSRENKNSSYYKTCSRICSQLRKIAIRAASVRDFYQRQKLLNPNYRTSANNL